MLRVNTRCGAGWRTSSRASRSARIAQRNYTVARDEDIVFDVVTRMTRHNAGMAVVTKAERLPRAADVLGVITKEHIADLVADTPSCLTRRPPQVAASLVSSQTRDSPSGCPSWALLRHADRC